MKKASKVRIPKTIKTLMRWIIAAAAIAYLLRSDHVSSERIVLAVKNYDLLCLAVGCFLCNYMTTCWRWGYMIRVLFQKKVRFWYLLQCQLIASGVGVFLPGSVSSDLARTFILRNREGLSLKASGASVFLDRIAGLLSLVLVALVSVSVFSSFSSYSWSFGSVFGWGQSLPVRPHIVARVFLMLGAGIVVFLVLLRRSTALKTQVKSRLKTALTKILGQKSKSLIEHLAKIRSIDTREIFVLLTISVLAHSFIIVGHYLLFSSIEGSMPFWGIVSTVPIAMVLLAVPLGPAGLGSGHLIYLTLFGFLGVRSGADVFSLFLIYRLFVAVLGLVVFVLGDNKLE